jgi:methionine-rich copper-binding protein CopC
MRRLNTLIIAVVLLFGGVTLAGAHAILQRAEPPAESTVHTPPTHVRLWFSEQLEPGLSSVRVVNEGGKQVDTGDAQVDRAAPNHLHVSLSPLLTRDLQGPLAGPVGGRPCYQGGLHVPRGPLRLQGCKPGPRHAATPSGGQARGV